jgi:hypothetical protein
MALPVIQARVYAPDGLDPEEGWPSQGRDLGDIDDAELHQAYLRLEPPRWRDGRGGPLSLPPGLALAMVQCRGAPSLGPPVWTAGALAAGEAIKLLLERGRVPLFPQVAAFDPYTWRLYLGD